MIEVPIVRRPDLYRLVTEWWYEVVDMPPVYPTAIPIIYTYFASAT